ncbi:MAG TPA: hypothetical protein VK638_00915, partial [Edaphobacter sp.]|nr:hypothetical protein [Edaphobacter sp.]
LRCKPAAQRVVAAGGWIGGQHLFQARGPLAGGNALSECDRWQDAESRARKPQKAPSRPWPSGTPTERFSVNSKKDLTPSHAGSAVHSFDVIHYIRCCRSRCADRAIAGVACLSGMIDKEPRAVAPAVAVIRPSWPSRGDRKRGPISAATIRQNMEKLHLSAAPGHIVSWLRWASLFLCMVLASPCHAQMGVSTGNGVAAPAKPLPAGMKAPVVGYEDVAAQAGLVGLNVSGAAKNKQYIIETTGT